MFIPDPLIFSNSYPGRKDSRIPDRLRIIEFNYFNPKIVTKLSEICSEMFIPDPDLDFYPSLIPDPGVKKALDLGSGSATRKLEN
jgi:hypothetical protein